MRAIKRYILGIFHEMARVRWIKTIELITSFVTVVIFGAFFAILLYGFDYLVIHMLQWIKFLV